MARRVRYKPSAKAICKIAVADRPHQSDFPRGLLAWMKKHDHVRYYQHGQYVFTRTGNRLVDKACNIDNGFRADGGKRRK